MDRPHLVVVDELAGHIHGPVRKTVRARIQHGVGLQKSTVIDFLSGRVLHNDLDPRFVQIANLWNQRVTNILVLDHHVGCHRVVWLKLKWHRAERRDHVVVTSLL